MIGILSLHFKRADRPASNKSARRCFIFPDHQIDATHTNTTTQTLQAFLPRLELRIWTILAAKLSYQEKAQMLSGIARIPWTLLNIGNRIIC